LLKIPGDAPLSSDTKHFNIPKAGTHYSVSVVIACCSCDQPDTTVSASESNELYWLLLPLSVYKFGCIRIPFLPVASQ
jgi:hypothetical protein